MNELNNMIRRPYRQPWKFLEILIAIGDQILRSLEIFGQISTSEMRFRVLTYVKVGAKPQ